MFRHPLEKSSTTCHSSAEDLSIEETPIQSCSSPAQVISSMHRSRSKAARQMSLVAEENKSPTPNLLQKLLFRQFSPKNRPLPSNLQVKSDFDEERSETFCFVFSPQPEETSTTPSTAKSSWPSSLSSTHSKQSVLNDDDILHLSSAKKDLSKSQQSELNSYLSKRRNTTGSISLNKIVDLKNTSSGNALLLAAVNVFNHSNQKIFTESKAEA